MRTKELLGENSAIQAQQNPGATTLQIADSTSYPGHGVARLLVIQGEQSEILCEQIIKWQLVLNGDKCVFCIFFSLQSYNVHQAITSLE